MRHLDFCVGGTGTPLKRPICAHKSYKNMSSPWNQIWPPNKAWTSQIQSFYHRPLFKIVHASSGLLRRLHSYRLKTGTWSHVWYERKMRFFKFTNQIWHFYYVINKFAFIFSKFGSGFACAWSIISLKWRFSLRIHFWMWNNVKSWKTARATGSEHLSEQDREKNQLYLIPL